MNWTDGCSFDYEPGEDGAMAYALREQFPRITREGMFDHMKAIGLDIYSLVKITSDQGVRKFYAADLGWYEVSSEGPPRARKAKPFYPFRDAA